LSAHYYSKGFEYSITVSDLLNNLWSILIWIFELSKSEGGGLINICKMIQANVWCIKFVFIHSWRIGFEYEKRRQTNYFSINT
jgi:hypothetical protein